MLAAFACTQFKQCAVLQEIKSGAELEVHGTRQKIGFSCSVVK